MGGLGRSVEAVTPGVSVRRFANSRIGRQTFPYKIREELPVRTKSLARRTLPRG